MDNKMDNSMLKLFRKILFVNAAALAAIFAFKQIVLANDFNLNGIGAGDLYFYDFQNIPVAGAAEPVERNDVVGAQLNLRIPFDAVKKTVKMIAESRKELSIINENLPIISKCGENLQIKNIRIDIGGIIGESIITFKPYSEAKNVLAIKIRRIKIHAFMAPSKSAAGEQFTQEEIMDKVMEAAIKGIMDALNKKFAAGNINLKAEDMLKFQYDKDAWIIRTFISTEFIKRYIIASFLGDVSFNGLAFDDKAIFIGIGTN
ncbi:MAG: hypothetical protein L6420_02240 [Elusimicrobia bacterium]|nr:hypothetical protein [Elusimicrobiota bacterium]